MEKLKSIKWVSAVGGHLISIYSCCKKGATDTDDESEEEKKPIVLKATSVLSSPTTTKMNHKHADNKKCKRELFMPASVVKAEPKVDFWIPEIKSLQQPEQEEYYKQTDYGSHDSTPASTPIPKRRNTMPSSVTFRSADSCKESALTVSDLKLDLYHTTDWGGALSSEFFKQSSDRLLGELIYTVTADKGSSKRAKLHLSCVRNLPKLNDDIQMRCVIRSNTDGRQIETIDSTTNSGCLNIDKKICVPIGTVLEVILLDSSCQDICLAHGTTKLHIDSDDYKEECKEVPHEQAKILSRQLKEKAIGASLMVTLEYDTQKLEFLLTINKLEISNINRFYDNHVYVKATMYHKYKKLKSLKSSQVLPRKTCLTYSFNKQLVFDLGSAKLDELILVVNLMERSLLRQDVLIGREIFGPYLESYEGTDTIWGRVISVGGPINYICQI